MLTRELNAMDSTGPESAEALLPCVYVELRCLASGRVAQEAPGANSATDGTRL